MFRLPRVCLLCLTISLTISLTIILIISPAAGLASNLVDAALPPDTANPDAADPNATDPNAADPGAADQLSMPQAYLTLVIDDMGNSPQEGLDALSLPGKLVYAILPNTPYATVLAELANEKGKQVILHLPMESDHHERLGPDGLLLSMDRIRFQTTIYSALASVPYAVGLNNHMGSLLTRHAEPMQWLMQILYREDLFFLDSRTTDKTVAEQTARAAGIATFRRDVFLDNSREPEAIRSQFNKLVKQALRVGYATGIAHPYPETVAVLREEIPKLTAQGIELVFASELLETIANANSPERRTAWQESLSPSPRAVKSSKPLPSSTCCDALESTSSPPPSTTLPSLPAAASN